MKTNLTINVTLGINKWWYAKFKARMLLMMLGIISDKSNAEWIWKTRAKHMRYKSVA